MIIGETSAEMCAEPWTRMPSLGSHPVGMNSAVINPHAMNAAMFGITIPARKPPTRWTCPLQPVPCLVGMYWSRTLTTIPSCRHLPTPLWIARARRGSP